MSVQFGLNQIVFEAAIIRAEIALGPSEQSRSVPLFALLLMLRCDQDDTSQRPEGKATGQALDRIAPSRSL